MVFKGSSYLEIRKSKLAFPTWNETKDNKQIHLHPQLGLLSRQLKEQTS